MPTKVLIVDGDETDRLVLGRILKRLKCWCVHASDEVQARNRLEEHDFELVVIDIDLCGQVNFDLFRYVRSEYPRVATLVVTCVDDPRVVDAAFEAGVYGYFVKPLRANEVFIHVSCALRRRNQEIQHQGRVETLKRALLERANALLETRKRLVLLEKQLQGRPDVTTPQS